MSLNEELTAQLTEDYLVEQPAINWLKELGYDYIHGSELNPENGGENPTEMSLSKGALFMP